MISLPEKSVFFFEPFHFLHPQESGSAHWKHVDLNVTADLLESIFSCNQVRKLSRIRPFIMEMMQS